MPRPLALATSVKKEIHFQDAAVPSTMMCIWNILKINAFSTMMWISKFLKRQATISALMVIILLLCAYVTPWIFQHNADAAGTEHVHMCSEKFESIMSQIQSTKDQMSMQQLSPLEARFKNLDAKIADMEFQMQVIGNKVIESLNNITAEMKDMKANKKKINEDIKAGQNMITSKLGKSYAATVANHNLLKTQLDRLRVKIDMFVAKVGKSYTAQVTNENHLKVHLDELKIKNDLLTANMSSVKLDVHKFKEKTIHLVKKQVKKELEKESEKYYGENSLCVGIECKFRSSNSASQVHSALEIYHADTLGFTDFALQSGGGSIHQHSESCGLGKPIIKLFGVPLYEEDSSPRLAISSDHNPGDCWMMKGNEGYLVVKLAVSIQPLMVSLEHLDKSLDRYSKDMYLMAPKDCEIYAWLDQNGKEKLQLGSFTYHREGSTIQTYRLRKKSTSSVLYMELRVVSNWGNPDCTCIYRFRVHGDSSHWADYDE